ncbi:MAG: type II toxin-antitoxin system VapC family toxin [Ignavibacterium sp.]
MIKYLLDTNICIYIINKKPESVIKKILQLKPGDIAISSISLAELYYGAYKSLNFTKNLVALQEFLIPFKILEFNNDDAFVYGKIRKDLEAKGKIIGAMDLLIASIALSRRLVLVTNNTREFSRINELAVENWAE